MLATNFGVFFVIYVMMMTVMIYFPSCGRVARNIWLNYEGRRPESRGGTPYVMGDTYVPRFWPPFFTLAGSSTIFLGYFFSSTNSKAIFWGTKTTNFYKNRSFWPQIQFFPRSFWVQFSAASGTPPSVFRPSTPPRARVQPERRLCCRICRMAESNWFATSPQIL